MMEKTLHVQFLWLVSNSMSSGQAHLYPSCATELSRHKWLQLPLFTSQGFGAGDEDINAD